MAEATIDSLRIDIEASSAQAADGLEKLIQKLERLRPAVSAVADNGSLNKLKNQLNKLSQVAQKLNSLSGFDKITQLVNSLKSLNELNSINLQAVNKVSRSVDKLREAVNKLNTMPAVDSSKFEQLISSIRALSGVNVQSFAEFLKSLKSLPTVARNLESMDFGRFADQMQRLANSITPVARQLREATQAFNHMPRGWSRYISDATAAAAASDRTSRSVGGLNTTLGNLRLRTAAVVAFMRRLVDVFGSAVVKSNQFVENLNLFTVTMGESADEAYKFAEAVNDAMGIDVSDWVRYQGFFQSIGKGFGIASDKADLMSQNLTQLSYDLSSFYNTSVDEAYNKVVSGISGELEPLRRYGFALDEATLKQLAYKKGITQSVETMTQAQKAQLRYIAILEQAGNIGVLGDMSRTIDNSANQLRIFTARVQQFARAVGNALVPIISAVLPYFTAFVQLLTEAAQSIADFIGFELPRIDLNASPVKNGYDEITAATDAATAATEKFKGTLAGVDQLNIIGSKTESGTGDGTGLNYDLNLDLPSYDFLNGVESKTKEIFEGIKKLAQEALPWVTAVFGFFGSAALGAGIFVGWTKIIDFIEKLGRAIHTVGLTTVSKFATMLGSFAVGLASAASSGVLFYNSIKNLITGTGNAINNVTQLTGAVIALGGGITAAVALGNPLVGVIAGIGAAVGIIAGINAGIAEQNRLLTENILYDNGGTKISRIADAFGDWAGAVSSLNNQTISKYKELDSYTKKIDETLGIMAEIGGLDLNLDEITPADAEALKQPFEELVTYLTEDFTARCDLVAQDLRNAFANLGIESSVSEQVQAAYKQMQMTFDENMSASQKVVENYLSIMSSGGTLTEAQQAEFTTEYNKVLDMARLQSTEYTDLLLSLKNLSDLDLSNIDLENDQAAKDMLQNLMNSYDVYAQSAKTRYDEEIKNIDTMRVKLGEMYKGDLNNPEYVRGMQLLDVSEFVFGMNYNKAMEDINAQLDPILTSIQSKYGEASKGVVADVAGWWSSIATHIFMPVSELGKIGEDAQKVTAANWLNDNQGYQLVNEFNTRMRSNMSVDITTEYDPNGEFAYVYKAAMGEATPVTLPVQIKGYYGDNDMYAAQIGDATRAYENGTYGNNFGYTGDNSAYAREFAIAAQRNIITPGQFNNTNATPIVNVDVAPPTVDVYASIDGEDVAVAVERVETLNKATTGGR